MIFLAPGIRAVRSLYVLSSALAEAADDFAQVGMVESPGLGIIAFFSIVFKSFAKAMEFFLLKTFFHSEPTLPDLDMLKKSLSTFITISPCFLASSVASATN